MKKLLILFTLLLLSFVVQAQEEQEDIPYVDLGSNFAVPALPNWEHEVNGETARFSNETLNAQIYVAVYDTQDIDSAILEALGHLYSGEVGEAIYSSRIGRTDGTWEYRLFKIEDTSITAYGMLKSGRVYVIAFIEDSANYEAYHLAIRSSPETPLREALDVAALTAIQAVLDPGFSGAIDAASNPNPSNEAWVLATYEQDIATASYLNNDIVYVTLAVGDSSLATELSNAFDTVFLGFVITPDNSEYLYLGLTFAAAIMLALLGSMWLRHRNLQKDLETIQQFAE
jgi:hypothetical protein